MRIAIVVSQFNKEISDRLLAGAKKGLQNGSVLLNNVEIFEVPGAFEIPVLAAKLIDTKKFAGVIALGAVMKGATDHYRAICDGVTYGLQKVSIESRVPVMFGVLMCQTKKQALERTKNDSANKGYECAKGLVEILKGKL